MHGWRGGAGDSVTTSCGKALPLVGGSGSCLGVLPHGVMSVISRGIYSGLYCGGVSLDMSHRDTFVLTLFDTVAGGSRSVDLHFSAGSHYGPIRGLLLQCLAVLFQHPLVDVYGHSIVSFESCKTCISGLRCYL